jgi:molybdenum cofactor biosynthesis enzyme
MVKGLERGVTVEHIALLEKSGGRSGTWRSDAQAGDGSAER